MGIYDNDKTVAELKGEIEKFLKEFRKWLEDKGKAESTVDRHLSNCNFFLNEYLMYENVDSVEESPHAIGHFLGYWFIKKAMWSSPASIKANAASLKLWCTFLAEKGLITQEELDEVKMEIKVMLPEWIASVERWNDPEVDDPWDSDY